MIHVMHMHHHRLQDIVWHSSMHFTSSFTKRTYENPVEGRTVSRGNRLSAKIMPCTSPRPSLTTVKIHSQESLARHMLLVLGTIKRIRCTSCYITFRCNHCGNKFSRKSMLARHTFVVFGAKVLATVVTRVIAFRRISFDSCFITFNARVCLMRPMERSFCLLSPGPVGAKEVSQGSSWLCWTGTA